MSKPSDLLPELQGRLPIRVELQALTREDFRRILTEPEASLIKQYIALMETEGGDAILHGRRDRQPCGHRRLRERERREHQSRRLQTVLERVFDEVSFEASDRAGQAVVVDAAYVQDASAHSPGTPICRALSCEVPQSWPAHLVNAG